MNRCHKELDLFVYIPVVYLSTVRIQKHFISETEIWMCAKYRERDSLINLLALFGNRKYISIIFCTNYSNRNQENGTIIEEEKVRLEI